MKSMSPGVMGVAEVEAGAEISDETWGMNQVPGGQFTTSGGQVAGVTDTGTFFVFRCVLLVAVVEGTARKQQ